jgi:uracil-DNA glycosylase family 4
MSPFEHRVPRDVSDYGSPMDHGAKCTICPLNGSRIVPALEAKIKKPKLIIVGEGPGYSENVMRIPFVGKTGKFLDSTLEGVGISRDEVTLTNSHLCLPQSDKDAERAAECCAPRLLKELAGYPADVPIMALGKAAARSVLGVRSILLARGFVWTARSLENPIKSADAAIRKAEREKRPLGDLLLRKEILEGRQAIAGRTVLPTVHPAFVLRSDVWTPIMNIDFQRAAAWVNGTLTSKDFADEGQYVVVDRLKDVKAAFAKLGPVVACDIETGKDVTIKGSTGKNPITAKTLCVGLSDGEYTMVIGPWRKEVHAKLLTQALAKRTTGFHNGFNFDQIRLEGDGVKLDLSKVEDTLLAHHAFASHFPQRLDHVVATFLPAATPWKIKHGMRGGAEEKGLLPDDMDPEDLFFYNSSDARVQARAWNAIQEDLAPEMGVYQHDKQLAALCKEMYVVGIRRDEAHAQALSKKMKRRRNALRREMRDLVRRKEFYPSHLDHVRQGLKTLGVGTLFVTATGLVSTASATMEAIASSDTRAGKFATLMLKWRGIEKARSTYIDAPEIQALADGRFHPNWKPFGTVSGRLSSRSQSMPRLVLTERAKKLMRKNPKWKTKDVIEKIGRDATFEIDSRVREIYIAGDGQVFCYFDLAQSEMRAAAYLSGDENFIASCESGDVHTANAKILFPSKREILDRDPKGEGAELRSISKNSGFAVLYGAQSSTVLAYLRNHGFPVELDQVEAMLSFIRQHYARYYEFCQEKVEECRTNGYLRTALMGRIRWLGFFPEETIVFNYSIQSFIADLMNLRLIALRPRLPKLAVPVFQGHDSLSVQCAHFDAPVVERLIKELWDEPIFVPTSGKSFKMPIDFKIGDRLSDF